MMSDFADNKKFENNWRNVQELGNRTVTFYSTEAESSAQSAAFACIFSVLIYGYL